MGENLLESEGVYMHHFGKNAFPRHRPYGFLNKCGSDSTAYVVEKETLCAQSAFEQDSEHEQREHVEEDMCEIGCGVHEHVGENLKHIEVRSLEIMQSAEIKDGAVGTAPGHHHGKPYHQINQNQVFGDRGYVVESSSEISHISYRV